jgi:acetoin utilization deacetylase AcuC-like enzyme
LTAGKDGLGFIGRIDEDTYVTTETFDVCLRATATWMRAVDDCWKGDHYSSSNNNNNSAENKRMINAAVALTRPPGHHATFALQNGFCLYNFAAAAALHAISIGCRRVCIVDWDVHYGQGCADIVRKFARRPRNEDEPTIRYVSIHQTPAFPYEGEKTEIIDEVVLTLPMPPDTTWTCGYQDLWDRALDFCSSATWKPDLVIVCAGYDALANDMLASCSLTAHDFGCMTRRLRARVGDQVGIVIGLEGGYCLTDGGPSGNLADAVLATVRALVEEEVP